MSAEPAQDKALKGAVIAERKRCGKGNCRCARGALHGPYYYRRWRDGTGRQRKAYVPRERLPEVRSALEKARADSPRVRLRELKAMLAALEEQRKETRRRMGQDVGRYWHGCQLRERRSFPAETRDRALYRLNRDGIVAAVGWGITEDDFVLLQRMIRSERKRRNRLGLPWKVRDPRTGEEIILLDIDLSRLPSYQGHVVRLRRSGTSRGRAAAAADESATTGGRAT
jgi:hypothetical protein